MKKIKTALIGGAICAVIVGVLTAWGGRFDIIVPVSVITFIVTCFALLVHDTTPAVGIYCSSCGQYLGTSKGFKCPCARCGSNRYTKQDPGAVR